MQTARIRKKKKCKTDTQTKKKNYKWIIQTDRAQSSQTDV